LGGWASKPVQNTRYVGTEHQSFRGLKPEIPSSVYREQWQVTESDSATDAHFEKLVLVEAVVSYADERFTMKDLGHSVDVPGFRRHVQCAHDDALLSAVGNTLIETYEVRLWYRWPSICFLPPLLWPGASSRVALRPRWVSDHPASSRPTQEPALRRL